MIKKEFREIFCNDFKLPIKIYDSPLFEYYLNLYEKDLDISSKIKIFEDTLSHFKTMDDFKEEWHRIKNGICKDIEAVPAFQKLVADNSGYQSPHKDKTERGNPYNHAFKGVRCLSIDLKSANFNSLRFHDESIVLGCKDFSELVGRYSSIPYYSHVKIFRQVVFEKLAPNRQQNLQRKMMDSVLTELFKIKPDLYVRMPSNDEIVVPLWKDQSHLETEIKEVVEKHQYQEVLKIEDFVVNHIFDDLFFKSYGDGKIQLRNVPSIYFPKAYKIARNLPLTEEDEYFMFEGRLAKFVDPKKP